MLKIKRASRRAVTLIEMIIVIALIGTIMGVLAWNYRGALDEGKKFTTEQRMNRIQELLVIETSKDPSALEGLSGNWKEVLKRSPMVDNVDKLSKDGWGQEFTVDIVTEDGIQVIRVTSETYRARYPDKQ